MDTAKTVYAATSTVEPPRQTWRVGRWTTLTLLCCAFALGASLRLHALGSKELSADEAASWAGAAAPTISGVIALEGALDPGKLAVYDLTLHTWIRLFGDSVWSLRMSSALLGILGIALVFIAVQELLLEFSDQCDREIASLSAAIAALVFATNPAMVVSARILRMYPLVLAAELAQVIFFIRAQRHGGIFNCVAAMLFAALAVATNFTAAFLFIAEGLWLVYLMITRRARRGAVRLRIAPALVALVLAALAVGVPVGEGILAGVRGARSGFLSWVAQFPPLVILGETAGWLAFPVLIVAAGFGMWAQRRRFGTALGFLGFWLCGPMAVALLISETLIPVMTPRYVLACFIALFALAGIGVASLKKEWERIAVCLLIVFLALVQARISNPWAKREIQWREATEFALSQAAPGEQIAVVPSYAFNVVRYYLAPNLRDIPVGLERRCGPQRMVIMAHVPPDLTTMMDSCFPRLIKRMRNVEVRAR